MKNNALMQYLNSLPDDNMSLFLNKALGNKFSIDEICIWGAGQRGIKLYYQLRNMHIDVMCFCDSDPNKYGYIVEYHYCIPAEYLLMDKEHVLIIVANAGHKNMIIEMLLEKGFKYIISDSYLYNNGLVPDDTYTSIIKPCDYQKLDQLADYYNGVLFDALKRDSK